jgi:hypothetical protein
MAKIKARRILATLAGLASLMALLYTVGAPHVFGG